MPHSEKSCNKECLTQPTNAPVLSSWYCIFLFQTHHHHQFNILKFGVEGAIIFHQILHKKIAYCCFPKHIVISAYCNICSVNFTYDEHYECKQ